tara:strand:- start:119 stop:355 length:237 start_codon:yes stop_codon:yes gene_type:complete
MNMGLVYTTHYLDFPSESWKLVSNNPTIFKTVVDNVVLEIRDTSQREHELVFKKGSKLEYMRSIGKYRLKWNGEDLVN